MRRIALTDATRIEQTGPNRKQRSIYFRQSPDNLPLDANKYNRLLSIKPVYPEACFASRMAIQPIIPLNPPDKSHEAFGRVDHRVHPDMLLRADSFHAGDRLVDG